MRKLGLGWVPAIKYRPIARKVRKGDKRAARSRASQKRRKRSKEPKRSNLASTASKSRQVSKLTSRQFSSKWPVS
jgi:hypothetical protein